jgi:hypothetical protein
MWDFKSVKNGKRGGMKIKKSLPITIHSAYGDAHRLTGLKKTKIPWNRYHQSVKIRVLCKQF